MAAEEVYKTEIYLNGRMQEVEFKPSKSVDDRGFVTYKTEIYLNGESEDANEEEYGSFAIEGKGFDTGQPMSMTIRIIQSLQGNGYSKILIRETCKLIEKDYRDLRQDQMFLIDGDGSGGFWDRIGMKPNRNASANTNRELETKGYEKDITFARLYAFSKKQGGSIKTKKLKTRRKIKTRRKLKKRKYTKKKIKKRKRRKRKKAKNKKKKNRTRKNIF